MGPRSLVLHRLTAHFSGRIRQNQRLLSSHFYSSSSALEEAPSSSSSSSSPSMDVVHMTDTCVQVHSFSIWLKIIILLSTVRNFYWCFGFSFLVMNWGFFLIFFGMMFL